MSPLTRRHFLQTTAAATGLSLLPAWARAAAAPASRKDAFSFVFLGDLHFDKLEHHDLSWVKRDKPNDVSQIENYSRITRDVTPRLFARLQETIAALNRSGGPHAAFVLQAGDIVEGLCGSEELSTRQNSEALQFVRDAKLGVPFLFTKGNHDITGPGAAAAFGAIFHPFLSAQARAVAPSTPEVKSACYTVNRGNAQFAFFDAYRAAESLEWFEAVAAKRTAELLFVVVHPPVVPYGARSTWHLFSGAREKAMREKFLALLGDQQALVLGGHIHRFNRLVRQAGRGQFSQYAISSVIPTPAPKPQTVLAGVSAYNGDQVRVEPNFSPATEAQRRAVYDAEKPFVTAFDYADLPGYAVITVDGPSVTARMYAGVGSELWQTHELNPTRIKTA